MPLHNVTIDDASALIGYHNPNGMPWKDSPANDSSLGEYYDQSYHSSNQSGAWSTFQFQGTAVYLFAATRIMHGKYNIFMDDRRVYQGNGYTPTSKFNQTVFNATDLSPGWHNLTFVNTQPGRYIEVDYITWTTVMPAALNEISGTPIPRNLGNMTYDPSVWDENPPGSNPYMVTKVQGATVNITFKGNGIQLYGQTGPQYGAFRARVDDLDPHELHAYSGKLHSTLLFRQDNLTDGEHTLFVTNRGNASLAISEVIPIIWSTEQNSEKNCQNIRTGIIIGLIVGLTLGMGLLGLLWFYFARRQRTYHGVYTDSHFKVPRVYAPSFEATPFMYPLVPPEEQMTPNTPGHYTSGLARGTIYATQYQAIPTSPEPGSSTQFEHQMVLVSPSSPGLNHGPASPQPYGNNGPPAGYAGITPPRKNRRPVILASRSQAQSPGGLASLRDRQVVSRSVFIRG